MKPGGKLVRYRKGQSGGASKGGHDSDDDAQDTLRKKSVKAVAAQPTLLPTAMVLKKGTSSTASIIKKNEQVCPLFAVLSFGAHPLCGQSAAAEAVKEDPAEVAARRRAAARAKLKVRCCGGVCAVLCGVYYADSAL